MGVNINKINEKLKEEEQKEAQRNLGAVRYWNPGQGRNQIRLMPPYADDVEDFCREVFVHWNVVQGAEKSPPFTCPAKTPGVGGVCPICDEINRLFSTNDPTDQERANAMKAKKQYVSNVVDLEDPVFTQEEYDQVVSAGKEPNFSVGDTKVQVFRFGPMIYKQIAENFSIMALDLSSVKDGRDLTISRTGKGKEGTKYTVVAAPSSTSFNNVGLELEKKLYNLEAISTPRTVADMQAALSGAPSTPRAALPSTPKAAPQLASTINIPANGGTTKQMSVDDVEALMAQMKAALDNG